MADYLNPLQACLLGTPLMTGPALTSWSRRQERVTGKLGARAIVLLRAGSPEPPARENNLYPFCYAHGKKDTYSAEPVRVDIYRSRRPVAYWEESRPAGFLAAYSLAEVQTERPVTPAERAAWRADQTQREPGAAEWALSLPPEEQDDSIRARRGDLSQVAWLCDSPYRLSQAEAQEAGTAQLQTCHLDCGVRPVHGRWEAYIGKGSLLEVVGVTDTEAEAQLLATAGLWRSWLGRVEEIRAARLGDLSWGWPLGGPNLSAPSVGDPQSDWTPDGTGGERAARPWNARELDAWRRQQSLTHAEFAHRLTQVGYKCSDRTCQEWAQERRQPGAGIGLAMVRLLPDN